MMRTPLGHNVSFLNSWDTRSAALSPMHWLFLYAFAGYCVRAWVSRCQKEIYYASGLYSLLCGLCFQIVHTLWFIIVNYILFGMHICRLGLYVHQGLLHQSLRLIPLYSLDRYIKCFFYRLFLSFGISGSWQLCFISACSWCPFPLCSWWDMCHSWGFWLWKNGY